MFIMMKLNILKHLIKMKQKNKKASLLGGKTVSIIIAVLCVLILIVLGIKMYNNFMKAPAEAQQAQASLERIKN